VAELFERPGSVHPVSENRMDQMDQETDLDKLACELKMD